MRGTITQLSAGIYPPPQPSPTRGEGAAEHRRRLHDPCLAILKHSYIENDAFARHVLSVPSPLVGEGQGGG